MKQDFKILLVEDADSFRESVIQLLGVYNEVEGVANLKAAREALQRQSFEVVILDKSLPDGSGIELIPEIKAESPNTVVLVLTADSDFNSVKKCMMAGADDYVVKSENVIADLLVRVPLVVERSADSRQLNTLKAQVRDAFRYEIIGKSPTTAQLRETVLGLKGSNSHVLITGESGTGKELVARRLHSIEDGKRSFVAINCGAIPENLIESELFGHKKGAFTGAVSDKMGQLELAHNGDLFLDEIGDLPLSAQAKLLRVVQDGKFFRVGGTKPVEVKCRIMAATNKDLEEMVRRGQFREDLYYRLNVVRIRTTALRQRKEDLADMAQFFCLQIAGPEFSLTAKALKPLVDHDWPGNIRELRNTIERSILRARRRGTKEIEFEDILIDQSDSSVSVMRKLESLLPTEKQDLSKEAFLKFMQLAEREYMRATLNVANGNVPEVATCFGLSRSAMFTRLSNLGIPRRKWTKDQEQSETSPEFSIPSANQEFLS